MGLIHLKKTRGQKSRATVPLSYLIALDRVFKKSSAFEFAFSKFL
jgi:hypothetical protein